MKTILFTGDSHTWGQGASKLLDYFDPPVVSGDLRLVPFGFPSYVSLFRNEINNKTNSFAFEAEADTLSKVPHAEVFKNSIKIRKHAFIFNITAKIIRIEFRCHSELSNAVIFVDGERQMTVDLQATDSNNQYKIAVVFCNKDANHQLKIISKSGDVLLYRIEAYSGEYAVINSGIGSCPIQNLLTDYWEEYVEQYKPDIMVMEAHTINDWLTNETPEKYLQMLHSLIHKSKKVCAIPVILTVSPIMGEQAMPYNNKEYIEFIEMSRKAAIDLNVLLADANKEMMSALEGLHLQQQKELLFDDNWHVNDFGHRIYAQTIMDTITNRLFIIQENPKII